MKTRVIFSAISAVSLITFAGVAAAEPAVLSTQSGMTVYTFDRDNAGQSRCEFACATIWPPVNPADIGGEGIAAIVRADGSRQAAYQGQPLYLFIVDQKAGDRNGDNLDSVWHVVPMGGGAARSAQKSGGYSSGGYDGDYSY